MSADSPNTSFDRGAAAARATTVAQLMQSDGWKLFDAIMAANEQAAQEAMFKAPDAFAAAKHMGAYKALHDMRSWPRNELSAISRVLAEGGTVVPAERRFPGA